MITLKNLRLQGLLLLLSLLLPQLSKAQGEVKHTDNSFTDNTTVGINFGLGVPWGFLVDSELKKEHPSTDLRIKPNLNLRFGVILGYGFPLEDNVKVGPEIGINYGLKRSLKIEGLDGQYKGNLRFEENCLQIPLALHVSLVDENSFLKERRFSLGYEFSFFLSSKLTVDDKSEKKPWKDDINLKEKVSDLPRSSGSILIKSTFEFPKGFYFASKLKIPVSIFKTKKHFDHPLDSLNRNNVSEVAKDYVPIFRIVSTSVAAFDLGINIMKLIF